MGDSFVDPELDLESALDCIRDTLQAKRMQADAVLFHVSCFPPAGFPTRWVSLPNTGLGGSVVPISRFGDRSQMGRTEPREAAKSRHWLCLPGPNLTAAVCLSTWAH